VPALFELLDELHAERRNLCPYAFGLVADDAEDIRGRNDLAGGTHNVPQQRSSGIWCNTLGSFDLRRVPCLAARIAMANRGLDIRRYCKQGRGLNAPQGNHQ